MAWPTDTITLLRSLIGDDYPTDGYTYTDARLKTLVTSAAVMVVMEEDFSSTYTIGIASDTITPDPANKGANGQAFQILTALRAAMMIAENDYRTSATKAVSFRDGPSQIDLRASASEKGNLYKAAKERYEQAKVSYRTGDGSLGEAIVSPYNLGVVSGGTGGSSKNLDSFGSGRGRF